MTGNEHKSLSISTIPIPKLTALMNNFICNTITHLNKLSVKGDEKLAEFDKKLNDLDIMTTLIEAKLNSLPEKITSTYPPIQQVTLDDLNPVINFNPIPVSNGEVSGQASGAPIPPPPPPPPGQGNDVPTLNTQVDAGNKENEEKPPETGEEGEGEAENVSPEEDLENFLKQNEKFRTLHKMIKLGVPSNAVQQKAKMNGFDMDIFEKLIEKERKANPNMN